MFKRRESSNFRKMLEFDGSSMSLKSWDKATSVEKSAVLKQKNILQLITLIVFYTNC